jgi:hypothetical protein
MDGFQNMIPDPDRGPTLLGEDCSMLAIALVLVGAAKRPR